MTKRVAREVIIIDHLAGEIRVYQMVELEVGTTSGPPLLVAGPVLSIPLPKPKRDSAEEIGA